MNATANTPNDPANAAGNEAVPPASKAAQNGFPAAPVLMAEPDRPLWPRVIGVLSIVLGANRLATSAGSMVVTAGQLLMAGRLMSNVMPTSRPSLSSIHTWLGAGEGAGNIASMVLVVAGVLLLRRRRLTIHLHWLCAVLTAAGGVPVVLYYVGLMSAMAEPRWMAVVNLAVGSVIRLAYPVFVVVWFCRKPVRRQMRAWRTRAGRVAARHVGIAWPTVLGALAMVGAGTHLASWLTMLLFFSGRWGLTGTSFAKWGLLAVVLAELPVRLTEAAGGWLLVRRHRGGIACLLIYAVTWLALSLAQSAISLALSAPRGGYPLAFLPHLIVYALLAAPFPVFLLVWFARPVVRAHIRTWGATNTSGTSGGGLPA